MTVTDFESDLSIAEFDIAFYTKRLDQLSIELKRRYSKFSEAELDEYHRQLAEKGHGDERFASLNVPEIAVVVFKLERAKAKRAELNKEVFLSITWFINTPVTGSFLQFSTRDRGLQRAAQLHFTSLLCTQGIIDGKR